MDEKEKEAKKAERKRKSLALSSQYKEEKKLRKEKNEAYKKAEKERKQSRLAPHLSPKGYFLSCVNVNKIYSNRVQAVFDFNLNVKEGEFIVLVGPSGCGKSTTLRMIAGLEDITLGELYIDGKYANDQEPRQRGVAMVFQSYALYPHLTVYENLAFGLRGNKVSALKTQPDPDGEKRVQAEFEAKFLQAKKDRTESSLALKRLRLEKAIALEKARKPVLDGFGKPIQENRRIRKGEIAARIVEAAEALQIKDYLFRKPTQLSGGQCQRVALGRAMVRNAKVFLLDEPLSNLDAKLRVQMRSELVALHEKLKTTMLYVTHDQTEAMTMADRIVVMKDGLIQQVGTPLEVYQKPANVFVATFIGSPTMNIREGTVEEGALRCSDFAYPLNEGEKEEILAYYENKENQIRKALQDVTLEEKQIELLQEELLRIKNAVKTGVFSVKFGIRPEDILLDGNERECYPEMEVVCKVSELLGAEYYLHFDYLGLEMVAKVPNKSPIAHGARIKVSFKKKALHLFDSDTEERIF